MIIKKTFTSLFLFISIICCSQNFEIKRTNHWFFGDSCGIDFSTGIALPVTVGKLSTLEGCSSISDTSGNLEFYTDGIQVWNSQHTLMPNGFGLGGHASSEQSAIIVPKPGSSTLYYILTAAAYAGLQSNNASLSYSLVDMNLNGGLGDVTFKNVVLMDTVTEHIGATLHQNKQDIWVVGHRYNSDEFNSFLITPVGISATPVVSKSGVFLNALSSNDWGPYACGGMKFSTTGCNLVCTFPQKDTLDVFEFDNVSGKIFNPLHISIIFPWHACFSPDNKLLYTVGRDSAFQYHLYQFNLSLNNPASVLASKVGLSSGVIGGETTMQIGPDGKIYCSKYGENYLAVINNPNMLGPACNLIANGFYLGGKISLSGLPNFIQNYFNTSEAEYFCSSVGIIEQAFDNAMYISPNPFYYEATIFINKPLQDATLEIYNELGQTIKILKHIYGKQIKLYRENNLSGIYFIRITQENKIISQSRLVLID